MMGHRKHGREKGLTVFNPRSRKQPGMVGKDSMTGAEEKNAPAGQGKVLFLGNRSDVDRLYQAMDVFVLPSRYEGLPVVGVEAQAAGLPCVMSGGVSGEAKVLDNTVFISVKRPLRDWLFAIGGTAKKCRREDTGQKMRKAGFDIKTEAKNLERFYAGMPEAGP